jgi:hypothetical protein
MSADSESAEINWSQIILEWEQSGLAQPEFCRQRHISYNSFSYQRNKHNKKNKPIKFAKIDIANDAVETPSCIRLILPDQTQIIAPTSRHALIEILTALRAVAC